MTSATLCACGCNQPLPEDKRPHAKYLDGRHRAAAAEARKGVIRPTSPAARAEAQRKRRKQPSRLNRKPERRLAWSRAVQVVAPHVGGQDAAERILTHALPSTRA